MRSGHGIETRRGRRVTAAPSATPISAHHPAGLPPAETRRRRRLLTAKMRPGRGGGTRTHLRSCQLTMQVLLLAAQRAALVLARQSHLQAGRARRIRSRPACRLSPACRGPQQGTTYRQCRTVTHRRDRRLRGRTGRGASSGARRGRRPAAQCPRRSFCSRQVRSNNG